MQVATALRVELQLPLWSDSVGLRSTSLSGHVFRVFSIIALLIIAACQPTPKDTSDADPLPECTNPELQGDYSYLVFFDQHSAVVQPRGAQIIREFINRYTKFSRYYDVKILLFAAKDASELLPRDRDLDLRRGRAVEQLMRADGIAADSKIDIFAASSLSEWVGEKSGSAACRPGHRGQ